MKFRILLNGILPSVWLFFYSARVARVDDTTNTTRVFCRLLIEQFVLYGYTGYSAKEWNKIVAPRWHRFAATFFNAIFYIGIKRGWLLVSSLD